MNLLKSLATAAFISMLTTAAYADFDDSDMDKDGMLSMEEYDKESAERSKGTFASYDANEDGNVDENEFRAGNFKRYDADRDGKMNREEYDRDVEDSGRLEEED